MADIRSLTPRELIRGFMRGNRAEQKLGYSPANAVASVQRIHKSVDEDEMRGYSEGFSDGMQRTETMVVPEDPANTENTAYREGYTDGLAERAELIYPSEQAI